MKIIESPYFFISVLVILNLVIAFSLLPYPLKLNGDAPTYLAAMKFLQGREYDKADYDENMEVFLKTRILTTPLMLYSSIALGKLAGGEYDGMLLVNIVFYFLIIFIFYKLVYLIYQSHRTAFCGAVLFFTNYAMINYGVTYRTDIGGWFFFLLTTLLAVKFFYFKKNYYLAILSASIGVLFKEYGALGMIPLGILILFLPENFLNRMKKILKAAVLFLIIPGFYHLFIYWRLGFSYLNWYGFSFKEVINNPAAPGIDWSFLLLIKILGWLFLAGWPIFIFGLYQEYRNFNKERAKILLAILPASVSFLAWPGLTQRIAFILVPWLAMISGYGLSRLKKKYLIAIILIIYVLINYLTRPWLMEIINI